MKKLPTFLSYFLLIVLPCLGLYVGGTIWRLTYERENSPLWKQLDSTHKFIKIEDVNSYTVWARTTDNTLYFWAMILNCGPDAKCNQWVETESVPDNAHEGMPPIEKGVTCPTFGDIQPKEPPGKVVECALGVRYAIVAGGNYYALLEDGTIWFQPLLAFNEYPDPRNLIYPCGGFLIGLALAGIMVVVAIRDLRRKGS